MHKSRQKKGRATDVVNSQHDGQLKPPDSLNMIAALRKISRWRHESRMNHDTHESIGATIRAEKLCHRIGAWQKQGQRTNARIGHSFFCLPPQSVRQENGPENLSPDPMQDAQLARRERDTLTQKEINLKPMNTIVDDGFGAWAVRLRP